MEPTNSLTAREQTEENTSLDSDKWIIRAALGIDGRRNAAHDSDSLFSKMRELEANYCFGGTR